MSNFDIHDDDDFAEARAMFAQADRDRKIAAREEREKAERARAVEWFAADDKKRADEALARATDPKVVRDRKLRAARYDGTPNGERTAELLAERRAHAKAHPRWGKDETIDDFRTRRDRWYSRSDELADELAVSLERDNRERQAREHAELIERNDALEPHRDAYAIAARRFVQALLDAEAHLADATAAFNIVVNAARATKGLVPIPQLPPSASLAAIDRIKRLAKSAPQTIGQTPLGDEVYGGVKLDRRNISMKEG